MPERRSLEVRSRLSASGELRIWLEEVPVRPPGEDELVVEIQAAPINPSDVGNLLGPVAPGDLERHAGSDSSVVVATLAADRLVGQRGRIDQVVQVGYEGAGVVVDAGQDAEAWVGRVVALQAVGTFMQYVTVARDSCLLLPEGTEPRAGAAAFINPLTALGRVATMRSEGHRALVHTAAASNLGQMLNRLCQADGIELVNVVRSDAQTALLRDLGAPWVVDSSAGDFEDRLDEAIAATGATLAFDAIGGGSLASTILSSMERAAPAPAAGVSRYGSATHKQLYVYGGLDPRPTEIIRDFGMAWGVGGWLLFPFLARLTTRETEHLRARVVDELTTTFASRFDREIALSDFLDPQVIGQFARRATGGKYLLNPTLDAGGRPGGAP